MYIEKIHIDSFGKLTDFTLELDRGVNIIEGQNESGKSTVAAFIKFVLYGIPPRERQSAASWQTGRLAGSITVNDGKKRFRIERSCQKSRETVQLIDGETNMPIRGAVDDITPGELFFGIGADMFEATAFVSQLGGTAAGGAKVSEGIENILFSADESVNTQKALAKLDGARAAILHKNEKGGKLYEIDSKCAQMEVRLGEALQMHDEILTKEAQLADLRGKYTEANKKAGELGAKVEQFEARTLLGLFSRAHKISAVAAKLRAKIEQNAQIDIEAVRKLEAEIARVETLEKEAEEASRVEAQTPMPEADEDLEEYFALGGREALESERDMKRMRAKAYTAIGVVSVIIALILIGIGVLPLIGGKAVSIVPIISGAVMTALGVTMLVLASREHEKAENIDYKYDFDALEVRMAEQASAIEKAKIASLAAINARRRYDMAVAEIAKRYSCDMAGLAEKLEAQRAKLSSSDSLRVEYEKYVSVLSQIRLQIKPYDEAELKAKIDESLDMSGLNADNVAELRREAAFSAKMAESLEKHVNEIEKTLAGLYPGAENPTALSDKLSAMKAERERLTKLHSAYVLASEKIAQASESLRGSISPRLAADTAELMSHITEGKYKTLGVGSGLDLCVETEHGTKPIDVLSCGTKDAAYLSLRMALVSLLYRKELPPMLYDEAFVRQDNKRLGAMLKLVHASGLQSIVFTSNQREAEMMRSIGAYKHVKM